MPHATSTNVLEYVVENYQNSVLKKPVDTLKFQTEGRILVSPSTGARVGMVEGASLFFPLPARFPPHVYTHVRG